MRTSRWSLVAGLLTAALLGAGCGGDDDTSTAASSDAPTSPLVEAAQKEGSLTWYSGQNPEQAQKTIDAFQEKYGIEVESLRLAGTMLTQRYEADAKAGDTPDVISASVPAFYEQGAEEGLFAKLTPDEVPSAAEWPKDATLYGDTTALIGIAPLRVMYNTELVTEDQVPKTWDDLLDPQFKGQIVFPDPRLIPPFMGTMLVFRDELGPDYLQKLGEQDLSVVDSGVPGAQAVASGEMKLLFPTEQSVIDPLAEKGAPVAGALVTPVNGTEMLTAISRDASHPSAARLFLDFVLSPEGQSVVNAPDKVSPLGDDVEGVSPMPDGYVQADLDQAEAQRDELAELLGLG